MNLIWRTKVVRVFGENDIKDEIRNVFKELTFFILKFRNICKTFG